MATKTGCPLRSCKWPSWEAKWRIPTEDTDDALKFCLEIASRLPFDSQSLNDRWIETITKPVTEYFNDKSSGSLLISLGRRRSNFIPAGLMEWNTHSSDWPTWALCF